MLMSRVCVHLKLPRAVQDALYLGAMLHDIGKLYVRTEVLHKPGALDENEWMEMRLHPVAGAIIADQRGFDRGTCEVILHHHERYDGGGYPKGLSGDRIPLGARLFSVVDTFDAVTSDRSYRAARPASTAIQILLEEAGTQFDPTLVEAFVSVYREAEIYGGLLRL
jgi:HD-GYP domain-containing protein (c-di-GMP phosphodiesterase class II)